MSPTLRFLQILFGTEMTGFIEVRVIVDKKGGKLVLRKWYRSADALAAELEFLLEQSKIHNAAVFFGVLPRREHGKGRATDVVGGWVVWADFDDKDFSDGRAGVLAAIARLPVQPSIVVATAHGLHCYWLLDEELEPAVLAATAKRLARALGADHTHDAARILRLPGSYNRKDPANPVLVTIEKLEPELRYSLSELTAAIDVLDATMPAPASDPSPVPAGTDTGAAAPAEPAPVSIADAISPRVQALLAFDPKVHDYFHGQGKREKDEHGKQLDDSSSGYDFSLAMSLIAKGVTDPAEIGTAIWHRPDGVARTKGASYIARTVERALALGSRESAGAVAPLGFTVESVLRYDSNPPQFVLVIEGKPLKLTARDLRSRESFGLRFLETFNRILRLPKPAQWVATVNAWLAGAEIIEMPPEASDDGALREAVERALDDMPIEEGQELDVHNARGKFSLPDGRMAFRGDALVLRVQSALQQLDRQALFRVLRELGCTPENPRFGPRRVRVWVLPAANERARGGDANDAA